MKRSDQAHGVRDLGAAPLDSAAWPGGPFSPRRRRGRHGLGTLEPGWFGHNSAQVERFLALLDILRPEDWAVVEIQAGLSTAPAPSVERLLAFSGVHAKRAADIALDLAPRHGEVDTAARHAAEALALRPELGADFEPFYAPFLTVIPLGCLETDECGHERHRARLVPLRSRLSDGSE